MASQRLSRRDDNVPVTNKVAAVFFELRRAIRIFVECLRGSYLLRATHPCVSIFGSARFGSDHPYCLMAHQVAFKVAGAGFTVMTGGGPGIMAAANRGAKEAGGKSLGCTIQLPREQKPNVFLDHWILFRYFFIRKLMLVKHSSAFIVLPGGFGTLDEVFEVLTLMQTAKIRQFPIILMGTQFWRPLFEFMRTRLLAENAIDASPLDRIFCTDSADEALAEVQKSSWQEMPAPPKRRWFFGSRGAEVK